MPSARSFTPMVLCQRPESFDGGGGCSPNGAGGAGGAALRAPQGVEENATKRPGSRYAAERGLRLLYLDLPDHVRIRSLKAYCGEQGVEGLTGMVRGNDLALELGAVAAMAGIGSHPQKVRLRVNSYLPNLSQPQGAKLEEVAAILDVAPEYLAYNVRADKEKIVYRNPERDNVVWLPETVFDGGPENRVEGEMFGMPGHYLRNEFRANHEACIIVQINTHGVALHCEYGDRAIVDTSDVRPSPGGVFLYWDGVGAAFATLQVIPRKESPLVRISVKGGETNEVPLEDVQIIGRVKGRIQRA